MENVIKVDNLQKHFGKVKAVDGVSFNVLKGEIFGFLGPNGAGKTTTIRCIMDFIRPTGGSISILGKDTQKKGVELKHNIGYLSGHVQLYDKWTGQMHIDFLRKLNGDKDVAESLIKRLDFDPTMKTKKLSSGNRQKLGLILALMHEPDVLVWDEPTNALDPILQNEVYKLLEEAQSRGATVFMSSHNLNEVERVCDRVGVIKKGKMVAEESVTALKKKRLYSVRVNFKEELDPKSIETEGVKIKGHAGHTVELSFKGDINKFIDQIQDLDLIDIEIRRASLEDIFLEYYQ